MGSVAVFGIVDMRESLRPVPKRLRTLLFAIPLAVQHRLIRDWLSNSRGLRVRAEGSALEAWFGRNENLTVGER